MKKETVIAPAPTPDDGDEEVIMLKLDFDEVEHVFYALHSAFHPEGFFDDPDAIVDDRFMALWHSFLIMAGWTEDEFWIVNKEQQHTCPDCGKVIDEDDEDEDLSLPETKAMAENKPN